MPVKPSVAVKCNIMMSNISTVPSSQSAHNCFVFYMVRSDCLFPCPLLIFSAPDVGETMNED